MRPHFEEGGRFHSLKSVYDGFDTLLFTPTTTSTSGTHIHDAIDSKRTMIILVMALMPCLLFGMYNVGYQNHLACGMTTFPFWQLF